MNKLCKWSVRISVTHGDRLVYTKNISHYTLSTGKPVGVGESTQDQAQD